MKRYHADNEKGRLTKGHVLSANQAHCQEQMERQQGERTLKQLKTLMEDELKDEADSAPIYHVDSVSDKGTGE